MRPVKQPNLPPLRGPSNYRRSKDGPAVHAGRFLCPDHVHGACAGSGTKPSINLRGSCCAGVDDGVEEVGAIGSLTTSSFWLASDLVPFVFVFASIVFFHLLCPFL